MPKSAATRSAACTPSSWNPNPHHAPQNHVRWLPLIAGTRAWAEGGYYARVFLNVAGREPEGVVPPADYERTRDAIIEALGRVKRPNGSAFPVRAVKPNESYRATRGEAPDLMLYLDDLDHRALGTVGHPSLFRQSNDGGPDGCNHRLGEWIGIRAEVDHVVTFKREG